MTTLNGCVRPFRPATELAGRFISSRGGRSIPSSNPPQRLPAGTDALDKEKPASPFGNAGYLCCRSESADKPGSVVDNHSSRPRIAPGLKQPTRPQRGPRQWGPIWSCSGWSLPCHGLLPAARCALTAPFHPYLCSRRSHRRFALCCTGRRLSPPRRYLAPCPVEPGLSSPLPVCR